MRRNKAVAVVFAVLAVSATAQTVTPQHEKIAIVGATLIDVSNYGHSANDIADSVVLIDDGKIIAVGSATQITIPSGSTRIDARGKFLVPGLIDGFGALRTQAFANAYLYDGVTTVYVPTILPNGGGDGELKIVRNASPGPRLFLGAPMTGYSEQGADPSDKPMLDHRLHDRRLTNEQLIARVDQLADQGFRGVTISYDVWPDQVDVIVAESKRRGMATLAEPAFTPYPYAIHAGVSGLLRNDHYLLELAPPSVLVDRTDNLNAGSAASRAICMVDPASSEVADFGAQLAKSNTALMPTLSMEATADALEVPNPWSAPSAALIKAADLDDPVNPSTGESAFLTSLTAERRKRVRECAWHKQAFDARLYQLGAKYLAGSSATSYGIMPGSGLHLELTLLHRIGLSPREAIAAATSNFADIYGWRDVGRIEPGRVADVFPARVVCMLFTLLTALLIYQSGRKLFGAMAGICALFLFVFDPNVLAHGTFVSTDMASACFILATVYAFYRYRLKPGWRWLLIAGLLAGLAMSAKFTGILVAPMLILLAAAEGIRERSFSSFSRSLLACIGILVSAWAVIWAFYGFRYAPAPSNLQLSPALGPYLASLPNKGDGVKLALLARFHLLPQAYIWGLANTKHTEWEFTSYFWGRVYRHGPWQYFPAAFLIKSTLPLLVLLLLTPRAERGFARRYSRELIFLLIPVGVYFAVIMSSHFDIGARHLMPVYPFLYVIAGAAAATLMRRGPAWTAVAGLLLAWQVFTTVKVAPDFMAYGNELWGGPLQVRNYLSDANVDWGQQLKTVKQYLDQNHISDCWFAYFPDGAVQPQDYGIHCQRLPTPSALWWLNLPMTVPPEIDGTVLISESDLDGVESGDGILNPYDFFRQRKPVAILQDGVYVYHGKFAVPLASAWVDIRRSQDLAKAGQTDEALRLAQEAVTLAPDSPRAQLQLADTLAAHKEWDEALVHYRLAQTDLLAQRPDLQGEELEPGILTGLKSAASHP